MVKRRSRSSGGVAVTIRVAHFVLSGLLCTSALVVVSSDAKAFEIFGWKFFESGDDEDADIVDPLHYTVALETPDEEVTAKLNKASSLVADGNVRFRLARPADQGAGRPRTTGGGTV